VGVNALSWVLCLDRCSCDNVEFEKKNNEKKKEISKIVDVQIPFSSEPICSTCPTK